MDRRAGSSRQSNHNNSSNNGIPSGNPSSISSRVGLRTSNKTEQFPERMQSGIKGYREIADYGRKSSSSSAIRGANSAEKSSMKSANVNMNNSSNNISIGIDGSAAQEKNLTTETKRNNINSTPQRNDIVDVSSFTNVDLQTLGVITTAPAISRSPILLGRETTTATSSSEQKAITDRSYIAKSPQLSQQQSNSRVSPQLLQRSSVSPFQQNTPPRFRSNSRKNLRSSPSSPTQSSSPSAVSPLQRLASASPGIPLSLTEIVGSKPSGPFSKFSKSQLFKSVEQKRVINRLGLQVQPICSAHKNKRLKYICVEANCKEKERVLCETCIGEFGHSIHQMKSIEEYLLLLESSSEAFSRKYYYAKQLTEALEHPPFLGDLQKKIQQTKILICDRLDSLRSTLTEEYQARLKDTKPSCVEFDNEIKRMEEIGGFMEGISNKNFFDLSRTELNLSLALISRDHFVKLDELQTAINTKYEQLQVLFIDSFSRFQEQMTSGLNEVFDRFKLQIPLPPENEAVQSEKMMQELQNIEAEIKQKRKNMKALMESLQAKAKEQKLNKNKRPNAELQKAFPYNTYTDCCQHLKDRKTECNTIPIFECCQQAYQCVECHFLFAKHSPLVSNPSKRYCMKCMSVFKVDYPTEVSINCNECVKKE